MNLAEQQLITTASTVDTWNGMIYEHVLKSGEREKRRVPLHMSMDEFAEYAK
jgi:transposase-like protein